MESFDVLCEQRDQVVDKLLQLQEYRLGTGGQQRLVRYLAYGHGASSMPVVLRKVQARLLQYGMGI